MKSFMNNEYPSGPGFSTREVLLSNRERFHASLNQVKTNCEFHRLPLRCPYVPPEFSTVRILFISECFASGGISRLVLPRGPRSIGRDVATNSTLDVGRRPLRQNGRRHRSLPDARDRAFGSGAPEALAPRLFIARSLREISPTQSRASSKIHRSGGGASAGQNFGVPE